MTRSKKRLAEDFLLLLLLFAFDRINIFVGMEFARLKERTFVNQSKYILDLLS